MEQLVIVIFIVALILIGEKTNQGIYNIISSGFSFYLAFTINEQLLTLSLVGLGLFQWFYVFYLKQN